MRCAGVLIPLHSSGLNLGDSYTIIKGATALTGWFLNLVEGGYVIVGSGPTRQSFQITYLGGAGGNVGTGSVTVLGSPQLTGNNLAVSSRAELRKEPGCR